MKLQLIIAGVFALVAGLLVWELPAFVNIAFIISSAGAGFFVAKNNKKTADKFTI